MAAFTHKATASTAFHGVVSDVLGAYIDQWQNTGSWVERERHIVTQQRSMHYRISPHFHPYVEQLHQRLNTASVPGLLAIDTEYVQHSDGSYAALPFSMKAALPVDLALQLPDPGKPGVFEVITLPGSVTVLLPDGLTVTLSDATTASLPGSVIANATQRGMRLQRPDQTSVDLELDTAVTLAANAQVTLPEAVIIKGADGTLRRLTEPASVNVPAGTLVQLHGALPRPTLFHEIFSSTRYAPSALVQQPYPFHELDFSSSGAYAVYNWELFYHIPLAIALHLSKNQRYEEAQRWLHTIFDPTDSSDGPTPERFWKVKPFQTTEIQQIGEILINLSLGSDSVLKQDTINSIAAWKDRPFRPHLVARYRQTAFMYKAVMAYLDNLIAWGDTLFQQDTGETINEATQIYVLAALILGERPQAVPARGTVAPLTYASRRGTWDMFGNTLEQLESEIPFDLAPFPLKAGQQDQFATLRSIGTSLYFCVPHNDKLLGYWDTVADRLFKIRNSLNLQGVFRQLPLFEPPIDPALLARAAAAGLDIAAVVAGANQPLPLVRFQLLIQKASEICQEVKALGSSLLATIEKEDNETLAILRARHEKIILGLVETVRYAQWQEAIKQREALEQSLTNTTQRYVYYERQLGKQESEISIPELDGIDAEAFAKFAFRASEPQLNRRAIGVDIAQDLGDSGGKLISSYEAEQLDRLSAAQTLQDVVGAALLVGKGLALLPDFGVNFHFWGLGGKSEIIGGTKFAALNSLIAEAERTASDRLHYDASQAGKIGEYARREQEWAFQSASLAGEVTQLFKQLRAAQIREAVTEREWKNHQQQIAHAEEIENFLTNERTGKKSNQALYTWLKREVRGLYSQVFQFAFSVAKKAERALQHELGKPDATFLDVGYMGGKEGLLAGEKLYFDLKRMEMAYLELHQREYELTKHVSLLQLNPTALLQLRTTGSCTLAIPEEAFDMDAPGHYFRRIKTVALSIPCISGPFTTIHCTLTLTRSTIRTTTELGDGYARMGSEDQRFDDHYGGVQSIVTSSAQNDSGLFETNLHDERYLPFEGSGVVSEWQLQLPNELRQFDYATISDVILHLRYTAREGGERLKAAAVTNLKTQLSEAQAIGTTRLFSLRYEFPGAWAAFQQQQPAPNQRHKLSLALLEEHYPFWSNGRLGATVRLEVWARSRAITIPAQLELADRADKNDANARKDILVKDPTRGNLLIGRLTNLPAPNPVGAMTLYIDSNQLQDVWLLLTWGG